MRFEPTLFVHRRNRSMRNPLLGFASATLLAAASIGLSCVAQAQEVPQQLQPPANEQLLLQVHAKGDQVYTCKSDAVDFTWTLKAPDAQLFDTNGKPFGKHFAGPSWEANDGSRVTGKAVANSPSPDANSIPWLLVTILSHDGSGVLSRATAIQRLKTKAARHQRPGATLRTSARKSACHISPTTASTPRSDPTVFFH
jgi:Protein of unknown function (DUF3455)